MTLENIQGMLRTAVVTHEARFSFVLPEREQFIERAATAIMAQQQRDADARFAESAQALADLAHRPR